MGQRVGWRPALLTVLLLLAGPSFVGRTTQQVLVRRPAPLVLHATSIEVGDVVSARVTDMNRMWVDLALQGGVKGRMHISDVSKVRLKHPSEVVRPGDQVKCFVKLLREGHVVLSMVDHFTGRRKLSELKKNEVFNAKVVSLNPRIGPRTPTSRISNSSSFCSPTGPWARRCRCASLAWISRRVRSPRRRLRSAPTRCPRRSRSGADRSGVRASGVGPGVRK
ncbi:unnamed protein product [Durusdinium trenchii]|uniref:S1 motif domain-containing protein n=1 Tax=Durusdinium trenchii TaxID=1381693 RepID=A0ABP0QC29_9DINO